MMSTSANNSLRTKALRKMEEFSNLPSMPQIMERVREISEDPKSSAADLANIVLSDHSLTTRILRVANSAFYGQFSGKVSTITQAIILMGFNSVRSTVMGIAIYDTFSSLEQQTSFDLAAFWAKSLGWGVVARNMARRLRFKSSEEAFIAGFMHDIGQPVICMIFADDVPKIGPLVSRLDDPVRHEHEKLGIDHQEVGEWLGKRWNLPPVLLKPMRHHHRVGRSLREKSPEPLVDLIYAADVVINKLSDPTVKHEEIVDLIGDDLHHLLGIKHKDLSRVIKRAVEQTCEIADELNIKITSFSAGTTAAIPAAQPQAPPPPEYLEAVRRLSDAERELTIMREVAAALKSGTSEEEILQTLLEGIYRGLEFQRALLLCIDRAAHRARGVLGFGVSSQRLVHDLSIPLKDGVGAIVTCAAESKIVNILDTSAGIYESMLDGAEKDALNARAFCLFPVSIVDEVEYVVFVENADGQPVEDDKLRSVESFVNQAAMALERFRLRQLMAGKKPPADVDSLITVAFNK